MTPEKVELMFELAFESLEQVPSSPEKNQLILSLLIKWQSLVNEKYMTWANPPEQGKLSLDEVIAHSAPVVEPKKAIPPPPFPPLDLSPAERVSIERERARKLAAHPAQQFLLHGSPAERKLAAERDPQVAQWERGEGIGGVKDSGST
jgi:hypothetical protein